MSYKTATAIVLGCCLLVLGTRLASSQEKAAANTVQVHLVITDQKLNDDGQEPVLRTDNVLVKQGKNQLQVQQLIPAREENAALQLFVLIDDTCDTSIGN